MRKKSRGLGSSLSHDLANYRSLARKLLFFKYVVKVPMKEVFRRYAPESGAELSGEAKLPSIDGVRAYVKRATNQEKAYVGELSQLVQELCGNHVTLRMRCDSLIMKLRNQSRDVGWMRRLLADLTKEWVDRAEEDANAQSDAEGGDR